VANSSVGPTVDFSAHFLKRRVLPIRQYGRFRGRGQISFNESGFRIQGNRVYSFGVQALMGLLLFLGQVFFMTIFMRATGSDAYSGQTGLGGLFLAVSYFAPSYWIVRKENLAVPFSTISALAEDEAKNLVSIAFTGYVSCSPVVMTMHHREEALQLLRRGISNYAVSTG
jgi:hypothetical protein